MYKKLDRGETEIQKREVKDVQDKDLSFVRSSVDEESYESYLLHRILSELKCLRLEQRPPVNYPLIFIISAVTSIITQIIITQL